VSSQYGREEGVCVCSHSCAAPNARSPAPAPHAARPPPHAPTAARRACAQRLLRLTPPETELDALEPAWRAACAAAAAAAANAATYPLDVARVRLTLPDSVCALGREPRRPARRGACVCRRPAPLSASSRTQSGARPAGLAAALRTILAEPGGAAGLYGGLRPTLIAIVPLVAIQQARLRPAAGLNRARYLSRRRAVRGPAARLSDARRALCAVADRRPEQRRGRAVPRRPAAQPALIPHRALCKTLAAQIGYF
jgi:hypothetical protein